MKGLYVTGNLGLNGGVINLNACTLVVTQSTFTSNTATSTGGYLYSSSSYYNLDTSLFQQNNAYKASMVYQVGLFPGQTSYMGDLYVQNHRAQFNTVNTIDSALTLDGTFFADNLSVKGSNGINSVNSAVVAT